MKRFLLAILIAATLAISTAAITLPKASVQPLQDLSGNNFCTTFSINEKKHLYGTAAHCVSEGAPVPRMFGFDVEVVGVSPEMDLAVVEARFGAPAYHLSKREMNQMLCYHDPNQCAVTALGFPLGIRDVLISSGHYIARTFIKSSRVATKEYSLFEFVCGPGCSGGPIINAEGDIQSVVQIQTRVDDGDGDVVVMFGGATLEQVREFFSPFMG
jgi:hypothetical protein